MTNHPKLAVALWLIALVSTMISGILFVVFGQVSVRKLRANPQTRKLLGFEFISGLDILGVSLLMSRPRIPDREYERVASKNPYSPSTELLHHMSRFDRLLAQVHYRTIIFTMVCLLFWIYWLVFTLLGQRVASP